MLITVERVKYHLEDIDSSDDYLIKELIQEATDTIELYCNRKFKRAIYKERIAGVENYYVKNTPIIDVISCVDEYGNNISYLFNDERIKVKKSKYNTITNATRYNEPSFTELNIVYEGGYDNVPSAIKKVLTEMVILAYKEIREDTINIKSKSEGSVNVSYIDKLAIQPRHADILDNYKIINI